MGEKMDNSFNIKIASLDELIKKYTETEDVKTEADKNKEAFNREFNDNNILDKFTSACASVMCISTVTGIPLDDVLEMYVAEMRKELESDHTKTVMEIGKLISSFIDKLS